MTNMPDDYEKQLDELLLEAIPPAKRGMKNLQGEIIEIDGKMLSREVWKQQLIALLREADRNGERRGMEKAKSRVLRRTELPKDAREPTRDAVVILGEQIADIIQMDIDELQADSVEKETPNA